MAGTGQLQDLASEEAVKLALGINEDPYALERPLDWSNRVSGGTGQDMDSTPSLPFPSAPPSPSCPAHLTAYPFSSPSTRFEWRLEEIATGRLTD